MIEFQKRGLPHAHILLTLAHENKPTCVEEINLFIGAKLPEQDIDPLGYGTVTRHMIHGPCGPDFPQAPCMEGSDCSKHYPKPFCDETRIEENGFVKYRRRDDGSRITVNGKELDNRWVVPYNCDLCVKYDVHINVERCFRKRLSNTSTNTCIRVQIEPHLLSRTMLTSQMQEGILSVGKLMR